MVKAVQEQVQEWLHECALHEIEEALTRIRLQIRESAYAGRLTLDTMTTDGRGNTSACFTFDDKPLVAKLTVKSIY